MTTRTSVTRIGRLSAAAVLALATPAALAGSATASSAAPVPYAAFSAAPRLPGGTHALGPVRGSRTVSGAVALAPRDPAALQAAAAAVADPRSPSYRRFMARGAFAAAYGPSEATVAGVRSALSSAHLTVTSVSDNHLLVHFTGTAGEAEAAFRTGLASYRTASGQTGTETTSAPSLPASVAPDVVGLVGLDTLPTAGTDLEHGTHPATRKPITPSFAHFPGGPDACRDAHQAAAGLGGLTDDQIAHAYGVDGLYKAGDDGGGQTVAIYELEPFSRQDIETFDACYFGSQAAEAMSNRLKVVDVDGGSGVGPGSGESLLDIEDVSGLAPGASIEVYEAPNTTSGGMDELDQMIEDDTAQVISDSWGFCEPDELSLQPGYINLENEVFEQAALQGQSFLASSGDAGSDGCAYSSAKPAAPFLSNGDPNTQPFVTAVGGTTITDAADRPTEQVWNDGSLGGGSGGGPSSVWGAPSWQLPFNDTAEAAAAVAAGMQPCHESADAALCRENPDVSAQADEYTGAVTIYAGSYGGWSTIGGTSSSAPLWAAMLADINASSGCAASGPLGFVSPALYTVASTPASDAASFNDITVGNDDVYDLFDNKLFTAHKGYDMTTGLGTPRVTGRHGSAGLASYLCALSAPAAPRPAITALNPSVVPASGGPLTITGSGFTGARAVSIGGYAVPAGDWSVKDDHTIVVTPMPSASLADTGGLGPQDGSGRAVVTVTGASGAASTVTPAASVIYVDGSPAAPVPSVSGVTPFGSDDTAGETVEVFGSAFATSGPDAVTGVSVGGVPATDVKVLDADTLTMTVPAYSSATSCAPGDDPATDVCQAQVVVTNAHGTSAAAIIHQPYTGAPFEGLAGGASLPGCVTAGSCEVVPATTEYDYLATPTIISVHTTSANDPTTWASEKGKTIATIHGSGFDSLGFDWVNVGSPANPNSADFDTIDLTPTKVQLKLRRHPATALPATRPLTVQTLAGLSNAETVTYAGTPSVSSVDPPYAVDSGGDHVVISGAGFAGVAPSDGGKLAYRYSGGGSTDQLSGYHAVDETTISDHTSANNPGSFRVSVCTITGCSHPQSTSQAKKSTLDFYEPGDPKVTSVSRSGGPAAGGTKVVIRGQNLADAVEVDFGKRVAKASNPPTLLTNGSSTRIRAVAPPGTAGTTVHIVVKTVETLAGGRPSAPTGAATFHYRASAPAPPRAVTGHAHHNAVAVTWKQPRSTGGHPVTGYRVRAVVVAGGRAHGHKPPPVVVSVGKGARSATLHGLRGGWTYRVGVQAVNRAGSSRSAHPAHTFPIRDAP